MPLRTDIKEFFLRLAMEPPFRIFVRAVLLRLPVSSVHTRTLWELSDRPAYLLGVWHAAGQARKQEVPAISVIEFGVAGGNGLLALQREAEAVEKETGITINVYGFDMGNQGLPQLVGDYRDHPDAWRQGDYPMDESILRSRLSSRTTLILGNVQDSIQEFFKRFQPPPVGFVSFDLDLYSSTQAALQIFTHPEKRMLWRVPLYFDDIDQSFNHKFAGELLAIDEFNARNNSVKIDHWRGVKIGRPFPERPYLDQLYMAHDLDAISEIGGLQRKIVSLPLTN